MPKIVVIGSTRFQPYKILAVPDRILGGTNDDEGYEKAAKIFHPAMDEADEVWVYAPDGIGEHTQRHLDYALKKGKRIRFLCLSRT